MRSEIGSQKVQSCELVPYVLCLPWYPQHLNKAFAPGKKHPKARIRKQVKKSVGIANSQLMFSDNSPLGQVPLRRYTLSI